MASVMMRSAYDRVVRTLVISIGIGSTLFTVLGLAGIVEQFPSLNPVYSIVTIAIFCGLPPVMALISFESSVTVLRALAATHSGSAVIFLAFWVPGMTTERLPNDGIPWIINTITVATSMAAIALPFLGAWIYLFATATLSGFVRYLAYGAGDASIAFQDAVMISLISGFMLGLLQLTLRAGREQDAAAQAAQEAAAATAAAETRERQRTRYHAFTHDDVLATLLAASQDGPITSEVTRRSATRTLEKMDQFRGDVPIDHWLTIRELESQLQSAASEAGIPLQSNLTPANDELKIPVEAADALTEALAEAMRNSLRHADWPDQRPLKRSVRATRSDRTVQIVIRDTGRGFNPRRVGIDRLGVRLSILQRVNSQPGGRATIEASRGNGTVVTLRWTGAEDAVAR